MVQWITDGLEIFTCLAPGTKYPEAPEPVCLSWLTERRGVLFKTRQNIHEPGIWKNKAGFSIGDLIEIRESSNMRSNKQAETWITDMRFPAKPANLQK